MPIPSTDRPSRHRGCCIRPLAPTGAALAIAALAALTTGAPRAIADPWLPPGDLALRHDIQLLADAGIIHAPIMTWPMSWPDIRRDVANAADETQSYTDAVEAALQRVRRAANAAALNGLKGLQLRASAASDPTYLRTFADTPREQGEASAGASWLTDHFAARVQATVVTSPEDKQSLRLDGSYVGVNVGNFMISAGAMERWWGPGWDGSLILSNNARPIPSLTIERNYSDAFKTRWLHWIGPWRASFSVGQAEGATTARDGLLPVLPDVKFMAARVDFRPRPWLEIALSRTAQFCGTGRPCNLTDLKNVLIGHDNSTTDPNGNPGNQLAGYDFRVTSPWKQLPIAGYAQFIGEDEANGFPSKFLGLIGGEIWGNSRWGSFRLRGEIADTACEFSRTHPQFDCAYRNGLFPQGYTYRGRVIGAAMDGDGRMYSAAALLVRPSGESYSLLLRKVDLNRGGATPEIVHALSPIPSQLTNLEVQYNRGFAVGQLRLGLGVDESAGPTRKGTDVRGFVEWRQGY